MLSKELNEELIVTITDKFVIGLIVLVCGFWLNRKLETFKREQNKLLDLDKILNNKRIDYLEKQLSHFYWPIYLRLQKDNAIWTLRDKINQPHLEKAFILPNHSDLVRIIENNIHLAQASDELLDQIKLYLRHVTTYQVLRDVNMLEDPIRFNEPWPKEFFPIIKSETQRLQAEYEKLVNLSHAPQAVS